MEPKGLVEHYTASQTEERRVAFHETEERYRALVELSPNAILVHFEWHIVYANRTAARLAHVPDVESLLGRSIFDFFHDHDHEFIRNRIKEMLRTGESPPAIEKVGKRCDGSEITAEWVSAVVPWQGKKAIQVILRDIAERKRYEQRLRESKELFRQLADSMPQIVWMARPDGFIDFRNGKFFELTGFTPEDVADETDIWKKILHPDDYATAAEKWMEAIVTGKPFQAEYRYRFQGDGVYKWHLGRALAVRNEQGEITRWFGTCTNIDDHKKTELALNAAKEQLTKATKSLEKQVAQRTANLEASIHSMQDLCYSIAHNLRAPLRAMQGFATAMLEDYGEQLDETGRDYARRIEQAAANMDVLIHDLLAYGHLIHQSFPKRHLRLGDVLENVVSMFEAELQRRKAILEIGEVNFEIYASSAILEQIFSSLLSNALKFVEKNVHPRICIEAEDRGESIRVFVRDNGIGIPGQYRKRIFRPFERLHTAEMYPGTGIGLAMVAKGVERLGGRLGIESEPGRGSCFWVEIPRTQEAGS